MWCSKRNNGVYLLTFFLTSFFFLSSSFRFFSSLIWARRCFLRSSSAFKSLLSDMVLCVASREELDRTRLSCVCQCHSCRSYTTKNIRSFADALNNPLGVATTRIWYWLRIAGGIEPRGINSCRTSPLYVDYIYYFYTQINNITKKIMEHECTVHINTMLRLSDNPENILTRLTDWARSN